MDFVHGDQSDVKRSHDLESGTPPHYHVKGEAVLTTDDHDSTYEIRARELQQKNGVLHRMRMGEEWLDKKMGIETQGIDIIHEENKKPPSILNVFLLWFSMTCHVGTIPIGMLGPEFGLSFKSSCAGTVVGTFMGALCTAYCGTLGPKVKGSILYILFIRANFMIARSSCDCYFSVLLRFLRRKVMLHPQCRRWWWIRGR
jgi:hypothetical protein